MSRKVRVVFWLFYRSILQPRLLFLRSFLAIACWLPVLVDAVVLQQFEAEPLGGLLGSEIGDIVWSGRYLWVATESGLARLDPRLGSGLQESDWVTFTQRNGLGRGAVSALAAVGDTVWAATLYDTIVPGIDPPPQVGGGLSFSLNAGRTWQHIPNAAIFDPSRPGFARGPSTAVQNPCYGLSITGDTVWAAFFAGATVRSRDRGSTWERVLPDGADEIVFFARETAADSLQAVADSLLRVGGDPGVVAQLQAGADSLRSQEFLHRTFEVLAYGDTVWVGTASGLTRSFDGGRTWKNSKVRFDTAGQPLPGNPGGNWVVAIERQRHPDNRSTIWAGVRATRAGEVNSMAFSRDHGESWNITGPTAPWGFAFTAHRIWAATGDGLYASSDGVAWELVEVTDANLGERLRGTFVGLETVGEVLWAGAGNGLGRSTDEGRAWQIVKSPVKPLSLDTGEVIGEVGLSDSVRTYAAPNPFSPRKGEQARVYFSLTNSARVTVRIYDFASRLVRILVKDEERRGQENYGYNWDGLDEGGNAVANGVYFYRIELDTGQQAFGKVVVLD